MIYQYLSMELIVRLYYLSKISLKMKISQTFLLMINLLGSIFSHIVKKCQLSTDLIVNGGFQINTCQVYCFWKGSTFSSNQLPGWIPQPDIEIGKAYYYNTVLGNSWVTHLNADDINSCISQKILNAKVGNYTLEFDWAARNDVLRSFDSLTFTVAIDNTVISNPPVRDYNLHHQMIDFKLTSLNFETILTFCGTGADDRAGALIDNVKLTQVDCAY